MKLMRTQDIKYIEMKRVAEAKVITHIFSVFQFAQNWVFYCVVLVVAGCCVCLVKSDLYSAGKDNGSVSGVLDIEPKGVMIIKNDTAHSYRMQ